jgi:hypothetical protein
MQERFAVANSTIKEHTLPVAISENQSAQYNDSSDSDGGSSSPKKIDATEFKIDKSLQFFWGALPHLEALPYEFNAQGPNQSASCMCSSAHGLNPW